MFAESDVDYCMASPAMLAETLSPVMPGTLLLCDETEAARND